MKRTMMLVLIAAVAMPLTLKADDAKTEAKPVAVAVKPATTQPAATQPAFPTEKQTVSYALGFQIGNMLKQTGEDVDIDVFAQAVKDVLSGGELKMKQEEVFATLNAFQTKMRDKAQKETDEVATKNETAAQAFLKENATKEGVKTLPSGMQYKIITAGTGATPTATSKVKVNYEGKFLDGKVFDSSIQRGQPAEFAANQVIKGWTEALTMMKVGAKWMLYIPADLAYGKAARGPIPPNSLLVFEVELLEILPAETKAAPK
jgi:FKBP-type peptidyl-prolyl cis-trans isomerase FklB